MEPTDPQWWASHGISLEVRDARPYIRWTQNDLTPVRDAYAGLSQGQRSYMTRIAAQVDGWVINRRPPPGMSLPHVYPEIRPDDKVRTGPPTRHYHGDPANAPEGVRVYSLGAMREHIDSERDGHGGENTNEIHEHVPMAKYVFAPGGKQEKTWRHEHNPAAKSHEGHLRKWHGGEDVAGSHAHTSMVKSQEDSLAKRLDVHPMAWELFQIASRIFFAIEGCIKADAILSAGEAVFSVPSVTLWDAKELPKFAERHLRGRTVIIVPDADWYKNPLVETQARLCQEFLRRHGITAHVAAPPHNRIDEGIKGIDDYLGTDGAGKLDDLEVLDRQPPFGLAEWAAAQNGRKDRMARDAKVLRSLAMFADSDGQVKCSLRTMARVIDTSRMSVSRALASLQELGAIIIDGDLDVRRDYFTRQVEWADKPSPTITIVQELRGTSPRRRLGDVA